MPAPAGWTTVLGALVLGCGSSGGAGPSDAGADAPEDATLAPEVASADRMMGWIEEIFAQGIRRPGWAADDWAVEWASAELEAAGLEVELDPIDVLRWESSDCTLEVWPESDPTAVVDVPCMAIPYSTASTGVEATVAVDDEGADLTGKIALHRMTFITIPQTLLRDIATDHYDPEGVFETLEATMPFEPRFQGVMDPAVEAGASAFIGVLDGYPRDTHEYFVPYDAMVRSIPGVYVSRSAAVRLDELLAEGTVVARIAYEATAETRPSHNVVARLDGASDDCVIIGTHHDGPWASAVEDASGMALVLAQARYWASVPAESRPHDMIFLMNGGHMAGGAGLRAYVERNDADLRDRTVVEIHLEHVARRATAGPDGELVVHDEPEARWWFVTSNPVLEAVTRDAIATHDLRRSFILEPTSWPPGASAPPTDGAFFFGKVPIVQHLAAPVYLFDSADTPDKIHESSLVPLTEATIAIVRGLAGETAASLRAQGVE